MKPLLRILITLLLPGLALQTVALAQQEETVVVTRIEGPLAEAMMATLGRAIERAESEQASALIIEIDTPGGEVTLMDRIARKIELCKVQPVAYVLNEAVSAGAFIAMACDRIYTYERAQIGSSMPISITPFGIVSPETDQQNDIAEKQTSYLRSKFRDRAQAHDRPGLDALAEAMVDRQVEVLLIRHGRDERPMTRIEYEDLLQREGQQAASIVRTICERGTLLNLTAQEAFDLGFSDGVVVSRTEVLEALGLKGARVIEIRPSWSEKLVGLLEHVQWLLLVAGLVLIYIEIKAPGFGLPGALGILCLSLLLFKNYLVGLAEIPEILLVFLGLVLIGLEIFVIPGFGVAGIAGITCVALGALFSFLPFLVPEGPLETDLLATTMRSFVISLFATLIGSYVLSRYVLPKTPILRRMILDTGVAPATLEGSASALPAAGGAAGRQVKAGDLGSAISYLRPAGKVELGDEHLDAVSEGDYIERGERIVVLRIESNHVVVRRAAAGPAPGKEA
ncbi:MAG: NfeD family protein [Planctomycetota bacterium]